jgi:hypothetical protein
MAAVAPSKADIELRLLCEESNPAIKGAARVLSEGMKLEDTQLSPCVLPSKYPAKIDYRSFIDYRCLRSFANWERNRRRHKG